MDVHRPEAFSLLQKLYDRTIALSAHRHALLALAIVAFVESSIFPIPPDVMLIPMVLAARDRAWVIAAVATVARSEEHTSELQSLMRNSYAVFCLIKKTRKQQIITFY